MVDCRQNLPRLEDCWFYHVIDLPDLGTQGGDWDLRGRFDEYIGTVPLTGKTVLDVGTASGFLTFEAERRGATVTSFDLDSPDKWQYVSYPNIDDLKVDARGFQRLRNSYWLSHHLLRSHAQLVTGDIYEISRKVSPHDVSIVGQILVHLRDPLEALRQVALVTKETMIIVEGSFESAAPTTVFLGGNGNYHSFWHLSDQFYRQYLPILGFEIAKISKADYRCNHNSMPPDVTVWTFIARRCSTGWLGRLRSYASRLSASRRRMKRWSRSSPLHDHRTRAYLAPIFHLGQSDAGAF